MNLTQIGLFLVYLLAVFSSGAGIYYFIGKEHKTLLSRPILAGECFLIGGTFIVGELLLLSFFGWYKAPFLWAVVLLNCVFLLQPKIRRWLYNAPAGKPVFDLPAIAFIALLSILVFRNCYFLVDIDSLTSYLFTQKLWLAGGTSLIGGRTDHIMIFVPQFDTAAYGLGLSLFGSETLFAQLVNLSWRLAALVLVFGYTSFRFNRYYGLAASLLVALNDHFFYSGENHWVLINGAVIAFLFAAAYNFWEARSRESPLRLLLALMFSVQLMANKYQVAYVFLFLLAGGLLMQKGLPRMLGALIARKAWLLVLGGSIFFASLWYLKNVFVTGIPTYPLFADKLNIFGWTAQQAQAFLKVTGGISPGLFLKYMTYLFVWPGINAAKIVIAMICFLPVVLFIRQIHGRADEQRSSELFFWLSLCIFAVMGTALVCHWEPRYYRYPIGVLAFTAAAGTHYLFAGVHPRATALGAALLIALALLGGNSEGARIILDHGGFFKRPSLSDNAAVLLDRIHTGDALGARYPNMNTALAELSAQADKLSAAAWEISVFSLVPHFVLPIRPVVSLWHSNTIAWDAYADPGAILKDLEARGIRWVVRSRQESLVFVPADQYAREAALVNRRPLKRYAVYDLPPELSDVRW